MFGPTAVGKTELAIALAARLREAGETPVAVSADALQVYAGLELLTGVASAQQQSVLEHRLVSFLPIDARFSVAEYAALAHAQIDELLAGGATPIVVGGTGLYLRAALTELALRPPAPPGARERWNAELEQHGPEALHALLRRRAGTGAPLLAHLGVALDPAAHRVTHDGVEVALSPREFALLQLLMERPGTILSRASIEERLYGFGEEVESNAVEVHIHGLRRKLGAQFILTVRGVGYRVRPLA